MNLLVITTLYPNREQFRHGIFVETRLRKLIEGCVFKAVVIAPVPWFPVSSRMFPAYSKYARVPAVEERHGITVYHPRYLVVPKIGMLLTPIFLALTTFFAVRKVAREGYRFDLMDAHYYYPDGVAVAMASRFIGKPFMVTARGSDVNVLTQYTVPRLLVRWAAGRSAATVAVSTALRDRLLALGVSEEKLHVFRNGVDLDRFRPLPKDRCKTKLDVGRCVLLSVGNLIELKGHDLVIRALEQLPEFELLIAGEGDLRESLESLAGQVGVVRRVRFLGAVPQSELVDIYNASDMLVLASSNEGMPNVVLESMACGTPVVATNVGGIPEVVCAPEAGVVVQQRDVESIVAGVRKLLNDYPATGATRAHAENFSWKSTVSGLCELSNSVVARRQS